MSDYATDHHAAMEALDEADLARRRKDDATQKAALRRALELESKAAAAVPRDLEPTRSVLYRSAASIAAELRDTIQARQLVLDGLRGNPPSEIKKELFDVLDSISPSLPSAQRSGQVVQQIRIRRAGPKSKPLTIPAVVEIQRQWLRTVDEFTDGMSQFLPLDASVGSFIVRFAIQRKDDDFAPITAALDELKNVGAILSTPRLDKGTSKERVKRLEQIRRVAELLTVLAAADAVLEVTMLATDGAGDDPFELRPPSPTVLKEVQRSSSRRIASIDVPQADDLEKVFLFVTLISKGKYPTPDTLDVVGRQVNYYRRAAEILGYVRDRMLTPGGRLLTKASQQDRWKSACERFEASDVGSAWVDWSGESEILAVDPASAEEFLGAVAVGLSDATIRRRAATLSRWHAALQERCG